MPSIDQSIFDELDPQRFSRENRRRMSGPGLRTFLAIAEKWSLTEEQRRLALGGPSPRSYRNWCRKAREHQDLTLSLDVLTRISLVLCIHQFLGILFAGEREAQDWLATPHDAPSFVGRAPIDLIAGAQEGLMLTYSFLCAAGEGLYMSPNAADEDFVPYDVEVDFG
jgi:uncharacterized protein (DUF2384 family)